MSHLLPVLLLSLLVAVPSSGQTILGSVRDSLGEAIPFASVVATSCRDEQVLAYTTTDHQGGYTLHLQTDCDSFQLTARGLGYQPAVHRLASANLDLKQDFVLLSSDLSIREIVIRDKPPPVATRRDTTEYNAAAFSDSTEFSVEDLLKKIPGIRVGENGSITYNGKTVERVLLEGDDLFSNNYTLATRNLRANMVAKVQMIDRYQENQLLKGIQESDRLVMNLTIQPDRKRSLSGSATGGLGYGNEWKGRAHSNLFSLSRKDKFYLIANANNIGENAVSDIEWMNQDNSFDPGRQTLQANPLQPKELVQMPMLESVGLPPAYTQSNRSRLLYIGEVVPVAPGFKIKISGWVGKEDLRQTVTNTTRYLLDSSTLEVVEMRSTQLQPAVQHLQAAPEYFSKNKKHALRGFLSMTGSPVNGLLNIRRNSGGDTTFQIMDRVEADISKTFSALEYTYKKSETLVFQAVSKSAWYHSRYLLHPDYAWYPSFFGLNDHFDQLQQTVNQQQAASMLLLRLMIRSKFVQWQLEGGKDWQWGKMHSDLQLQNGLGETWSPDTAAYRNRLQLHAPNWFLQSVVTYNIGPLLIRSRLQVRYQSVRLTAPDLIASSPSPWVAEPQLDLRYTWSERSACTGFYKFRQEMPALTDLHPAYLFTDYQTLERGLPDLAWTSGHQAGLVYRFNNPLRQFSWHLGTSWRRQDNDFGTQYQINPFLIIQEAVRPLHSASYAVNGESDRYFKNLSMRFVMGAGFNARREQARINNELRNLNTRNYTVNFGCGTAFNGWVNVILDSRLNYTLSGAQSETNFKTKDWFSTLQIWIKPSSKLQLKVYTHHTANRTGPAPYRHFYAADGLVILRLPKWHSDAELTAFNLLGSRRFERVNADAFFQSRTSVTAIGRFFQISWSWNF